MKRILAISLCFIIGAVYFTDAQSSLPYHLIQEDKLIILPPELREVSGLSIVDSKTLICIQDEEGIAFIYDLKKQEVTRKIVFAGPGDYEGIAPAGNDLYVLRSDGVLFRIHNFEKEQQQIDSIQTGIPNKDNEGLCYDKVNKRLLIGSKSKIAKGAEYKNLRTIYAFDLQSKTLQKEPLYVYDIQVIKDFAQKNKIELPTKPSKKNPNELDVALKFQISGIYLHPKSKLLYVLSASDYYLFVFDGAGAIKHLEVLDPLKFNKAEGIAIMPNGDLYISNEGQTGDPKILLFSEKNRK
ncbi:hypothetical protein D3C87_16370 [compost metagenome]